MARRDTPDARQANHQAAENIEAILKLEKEAEQELSAFHRLSHAFGGFVGTIYFAVLQCVAVLAWIGANTGFFGNAPFDPYPFPLLATLLALEAVLLTSFVLIRQNTMDRRSERRNHLDLQINLLAEKEATSILNVVREIAEHLKVDVAPDPEREALSKDTPVEDIARDLRAKEEEQS
ncbi:DUF1003 domain-containing protein [Bradyrhizobium sp.]|uniref:DUF1003 domain-containing protein n=1 Tax=Bradyrhizobium sp. TaxID=376 RepID=UPI002E0ABFA3|nr:DUF1003 domain-containing protein [Bradyrhizobium sp.]